MIYISITDGVSEDADTDGGKLLFPFDSHAITWSDGMTCDRLKSCDYARPQQLLLRQYTRPRVYLTTGASVTPACSAKAGLCQIINKSIRFNYFLFTFDVRLKVSICES